MISGPQRRRSPGSQRAFRENYSAVDTEPKRAQRRLRPNSWFWLPSNSQAGGSKGNVPQATQPGNPNPEREVWRAASEHERNKRRRSAAFSREPSEANMDMVPMRSTGPADLDLPPPGPRTGPYHNPAAPPPPQPVSCSPDVDTQRPCLSSPLPAHIQTYHHPKRPAKSG
ncbi:unnamed protein product [Pleuronectes platessa]|uniref:Uncharacterized protein n=1 Tax=Pleuronectes platessa TaxID=8262 RepID=A0A9N7YZN3_PLEPL|nr:unnamed protein product [Pleuronectes platessa]